MTREDTTIVAPATPGGTGAVSILRLSGPDALLIAARLTGLSPSDDPPRTMRRCSVRDASGGILDTALAVFFPGPHSFTGEDVVEIHLHGNPVVVETVVRAACAAGAVPAEPGEFSRRAFHLGKMDLTQAEGLCDLIAARTEEAARSALRQMRGGIREEIVPLRERLFSLLTLQEAAIDFAEEDGVPSISSWQLAERVSEIIVRLEELLRSYEAGRRFRDGATVVIAGVANVGKSRLLNRLAGEERAIVTETPGTTRDYLHADIAIGGVPVILIDTAGLRETADPVEREGVRRSREIVATADLVLFVLDGSRSAAAADRSAYEEVASLPHLVLLNKSDLAAVEEGVGFAGAGKRGALRLSAKTGEGIGDLVAAVAREVAPAEGAIRAQAPLTRARQRLAVERALSALSRAKAAAEEGLPLEFPAADVREAAGALAELLGEVAPEEVLDAIFDAFCVGK
ncbi:MAG TPA: tRNA uridine-5-carboxymethylaminomethyl(34) synthesis GTPase MnmE [Thermodesulfobacteriota bacterium]|nr:tRNA uridine-5-carboxymethylaminomethyl(34) synthesis GTPase MnmE [Thermodesulfobacteriota bacterium]